MRYFFMGCAMTALAISGQAQAQTADNQAADTSFPAGYFDSFHPNSALDMVRHLPGFTFQPGDPALRGAAEAAGNVVIDGKRVADKTFTLDEVLDRIPASQVERIDLVRGGGSGIDMLGQPVVANIIRRAAAGGSAAVTVSSALYLDGRITPGITIEKSHSSGNGHSYSVSAALSRYVEVNKGGGTRLRSDGAGNTLERADVDARAGGLTGYGQATVELPALGGALRVNAVGTWTDYRDRQKDRRYFPTPLVTTLDEDLGGIGGGQAGGELGAHLSREFGDRVETETTLLARMGRKSYESSLAAPGAETRFSERDSTTELVARLQMRVRAGKHLSFALDAEGAYNRLDTASALAFNAFQIALPNGRAIVREDRGNGGGTATWTPSARIEMQAGLHAEISRIEATADTPQTRSYPFLKPLLQLTWTPGAKHRFRLLFERTVGQLDFTNFIAAASLDKGVVSAGNAGLRPENRWFGEIAWEWHPSKPVSLVATWRHSWLRDAIDRVPVRAPGSQLASFDAPGNIGSGTEDLLSLDMTVPLRFVLALSELKLNASYRRTRVTDPTTFETRPISGISPFTLRADFHQDLPRWKAAWGVHLETGTHSATWLFNEVDRNSSTMLLSTSIDYNPNAKISIRLEASDMLGRSYRRVVNAYGGPRGINPISYSDDRRLSLGRAVSLKVRRSF